VFLSAAIEHFRAGHFERSARAAQRILSAMPKDGSDGSFNGRFSQEKSLAEHYKEFAALLHQRGKALQECTMFGIAERPPDRIRNPFLWVDARTRSIVCLRRGAATSPYLPSPRRYRPRDPPAGPAEDKRQL
jgi:hypothetical protein